MMEKVSTMFTNEQVTKRIEELAKLINDAFNGENELIAICTLKGASMFFCDLVKKINVPLKFEFVKLSSYGSGTTSSNKFENVSLNLPDLNGKNVLLVEDIVDTGNTLAFLNDYFTNKYNLKNYKTIALLNKPSRRKTTIDADFYGFEIEDKFVVGYGLDYDQRYRNLDYIGELSFE